MAYYNCMSKIVKKIHISESSVHKYQKSCSKLIWLFYYLLLLFEQKYHKTHISAISVQKVSQIVFLADLTVLRLTLQMYEQKCHKTHISTISVHKYHKSCS